MKATGLIGLILIGILMASAQAQPYTPVHFWSQRFGGATYSDEGRSVAVDASGNIFVTGTFQGTVDFGGGNRVSAGGTDIFLAKYGPDGTHLWSLRFGSTGDDEGNAVAVDGSGNVFVTGTFRGTVNFGGFDQTSYGLLDVFLAKFTTDGTHLWSRHYGGTDDDICRSVAVDGSGNVYITGYYEGTATFGGSNIASNGGTDIFLAKYTNNSTYQWTGHFGGAGNDFGESVTTDDLNYIYTTGSFSQTVNFGDGDVVSHGGLDIFLMKHSSSAVFAWVRQAGGTSPETSTSIAVDSQRNVYITGYFQGSADFGGGLFGSAGMTDVFVASYTTNNAYRWSLCLGNTMNDQGFGIAVDGSRNVYVAGHFEESIYIGDDFLTSAGSYDVFLAKYTHAGIYQWSLRAGDISQDSGRAITADGLNDVIATGYFMGTADFGGDDLVSAGGRDIFLAKYNDVGAEPVISSISDIGNDQGRSVLIEFEGSGHDDQQSSSNVTQYEAYRRIDAPPAAAVQAPRAGMSPDELLAEGWTQVAAVSAHGEPGYSMVAPTIGDSTIAEGQYLSVFYVRAATASPYVFFDSEPDSGYSLDNLAPGVPLGLFYSAGVLSWDESPAADFDYFTVYGASTDDFGAATLVDYTVSASMDVTASPYAYYFVTATDFSGNEGAPAALDVATGAEGPPASYILSVSSFPNPFNPRTTVRYTVPSRGPVTVAVYDSRGALVATLVDRVTHDAGAYSVEWGGRAGDGSPVTSGVYFARIEQEGSVRSAKPVLLR
jgi:hypothetical protein